MANAEHLKILREGVEVWNRWREENPHIIPDLSGLSFEVGTLRHANLTRANMIRANLFSALMTQADLTGANLTHADLTAANLNGAKLEGTNLRLAQMRHTKLRDAKLNYAVLRDTNFQKADLNKTYLSKAQIGHTIFSLNDLSNCINLESVEVWGPCSIDFQTLNSSRNLPKSFLLKIGLPELYIDYLPDFYQNEGIRYFPAFLSHSWANKPFARQLYEALISKGIRVFFDEKEMKPGDDIFTGISRGIELYDKTILVCSEESLNSWWVDQEIELVFEKERKLQKETGEKTGLLIPIKIDNTIDTWPNGKRMAIQQRFIGNFTNWQDPAKFEKALAELVHALNADRKELPPVSYLKKRT